MDTVELLFTSSVQITTVQQQSLIASGRPLPPMVYQAEYALTVVAKMFLLQITCSRILNVDQVEGHS